MYDLDDLEDEFDFYGDSYSNKEESVEDVKGITDDVTSYTYTDIEYPCIVFPEGFTCQAHQMKVISHMLKGGDLDRDTTLYFTNNNQLFKIGKIAGIQIESLLDMVGTDSVYGYYIDGTKISGDKMYTLCVF